MRKRGERRKKSYSCEVTYSQRIQEVKGFCKKFLAKMRLCNSKEIKQTLLLLLEMSANFNRECPIENMSCC